MYPEFAEINGKQYKLNTDYKVALRCFEVVEDADISDTERALAVVYLLYGFIPNENIDKFLEKAALFLRCGAEQAEEPQERDIDLNTDRCYIMASFMSDYRIDLSDTDMHFWKYIDLIKGLTEHCVLSKVREIRTYDISEVKDRKYRAKIIKAQEALALPKHLTKEEKEALEEFEQQFI